MFVHKGIVAFCNIGTFGDVASFRWLSMGRCVWAYVDEEYHRGWRRWIWRIDTDKIWKSDMSDDTLWLFLHSWWQTKSQRSLDFFLLLSVTLFTNVLVTRVVCLSLRKHGSRAHSCTDNFTIEESEISDYKKNSFDYLILWVGIIILYVNLTVHNVPRYLHKFYSECVCLGIHG